MPLNKIKKARMPIITVSLTRFTREPSPCQKLREIKYVRIEKLASEPALAVDLGDFPYRKCKECIWRYFKLWRSFIKINKCKSNI